MFRINIPNGVGSFEDTGVSHQINYGDGSAFINGTIGLAEVAIAGHTISSQGT
jgi:hypothetical protein